MSSEQLFCPAFRQDGLYLDNASILLSGSLKMLKATPYGVVGGIGSPPYGVTATISVSGCLN
ncbi:MAG: hypothetical protein IKX14_04050, partial [Neisseriaceae bacterium]|nr:hypothetical protein [Neisseriaceae bacterium]